VSRRINAKERRSMQRNTTRTSIIALSASLTVACLDRKELGELNDTGNTDDGHDTHDTHDTDGDPSDSSPATTMDTDGSDGSENPVNPKNVDIIFMLDDSGSMIGQQHAIATNLDALIGVLDEADMNYRIAFTTSDNGNPLCPTNVKQPNGGTFVLQSCHQRISHFVFATVPPLDAQQAACLDICAHESIAITPTKTDNDPVARARPWIERIDGQTNLPPEVSMTEALRCFAPMGIAGCGYEEQLESVYKAVARSQDASESQYDFIRSDAMLAIVLVSDEADGSFNRSAGNPYDTAGNKVFWQDNDANFPSSAVSWNAGVECVGSGSPYDDCHSQHYDIDGNVLPAAQAASSAVFHPVTRYVDQLNALHKPVVVMGILGVPPGYEDGAPIVYRDDPQHPQFMLDFGIGPSCESPLILPGVDPFQPLAVPPVRQREVAESFPGRIYSICGADYARILANIGADIIDG
jgi:hypothetical protein